VRSVVGVRVLLSIPVSAVLALYLLATSRWGSYLRPPGFPAYVGDVGLGLAAVQAAVLVPWRRAVELIGRAPLLLLVALVLPSFALLRFLVEPDTSLVALRDLAPYGYGVLALASYLLPVDQRASRSATWRRVIYGVFALHLVWAVGLPRVPGFPWSLPNVGSDAVLLVVRPDIDSAVMGIAAAYAINDLLRHHQGRKARALLLGFAGLNGYGVLTMSTRAGLLAALVAIGAVIYAWSRSTTRARAGLGQSPRRGRARALRGATVAAVILVLVGTVVAVTPTGKRLIEGFGDTSAQSYGTIEVRQVVWDDVFDYVVRSPERTAIGVGFGRNFIEESGSRNALEGSTYKQVRSPHNYVVGTLARLGVAGALLISLMVVLGLLLATRLLVTEEEPMSVLAALVIVAIPVVAMLGVVLESPFGALPYFWAIGQASAAWIRRADSADGAAGGEVASVPVVRAGDTVTQ
jgi:hypothetical protein